jgi:hypothetical protein
MRALYIFRAGEISGWSEPGRKLHNMNTDTILVKSRRKSANNAAENFVGFVNISAGEAKVLLKGIRVYCGILCLVAGFSRGVHEIFGLLRCNAT